MHCLQGITGMESPEHNLVDLVSNRLSSDLKLFEGGKLIQNGGLLQELFIGESSAEGHDVRAGCVDEVADGVMGVVQHFVDVCQLEEHHQLDREESVILGANFTDLFKVPKANY